MLARQGGRSGSANRRLALEAACRGKDSVIIRRRLEKLLPNPGIDSPTVARESVRNIVVLFLALYGRSLLLHDEREWKGVPLARRYRAISHDIEGGVQYFFHFIT